MQAEKIIGKFKVELKERKAEKEEMVCKRLEELRPSEISQLHRVTQICAKDQMKDMFWHQADSIQDYLRM